MTTKDKNTPDLAAGAARNDECGYAVNIAHANPNVNKLLADFRRKHNVDREVWRAYCIITARHFRDSAPPKIRAQFTAKPSKTPPEAVELAEIFTMLQTQAEDRAKSSGVNYSPVTLWHEAVRLAGGVA